MMIGSRSRVVGLGMALAWSTGCSDDVMPKAGDTGSSGEYGRECSPGEERGCPCEDAFGTQRCLSSGFEWGSCMCDTSSTTGSTGATDDTSTGTSGGTSTGIPPSCGNAMLDPGESCDDGNDDDTDACLSTCEPATCGDGITWNGVEGCDDGNLENNDGCNVDCVVSGTLLWSRTHANAQGGDAVATSVAVSSEGDIYVAGYEELSGLGEGQNVWLRKYDADGSPLWTRTHDGTMSGDDAARAVTVDLTNNVVLAGYEDRIEGSNPAHIWVRAHDSDGLELWTHTHENAAAADAVATGVHGESSGNVVVVGWEDHTAAGESIDIWIREYAGTGTALWTRTFVGADGATDIATGVSTTPGGQILVSGHLSDSGQTEAWLGRYATDGVLLWTRTYVDPIGYSASASGVAADLASFGAIVGSEDRSFDGEGLDIYARKYDPDGTMTGHETYSGPPGEDDHGRGVATDADNYIFVVGDTAAGPGEPPDIWLRKYHPDGAVIWTQTQDPSAGRADMGRGVAVDPDGNAIVVGTLTTMNGQSVIWVGKFAP